MMTAEEFTALTAPEVQRAIADARGRDPFEVALDARIPHARIVATQVKYLARAERKLPAYAAAQCILPPRAFEQASSEACADTKRLSGGTALDLTCGLGVDALHLGRSFRRVVTLERDPVLAEVARWNFRRLGASNIEVVCAAAEEYLMRHDVRFDWIYADPDRRAPDGRKQVRLEACSPDIGALLPRLREVAPRLCVKHSPLFDVDEALRIYGPCRVEALSVGDECKEVVIYADGSAPLLAATAIGRGTFSAAPGAAAALPAPEAFDAARYRWLVIPDVALQKTRLARLHLRGQAEMWSPNGFAFAEAEPRDILGRKLEIDRIEPYDPRRLRRELKGAGVEIYKRDFPLSTTELMRRLGAGAGSQQRLAFTKIGNDYWVIRLK